MENRVPRKGEVGRYAPSPTGDQHLGNLRTALEAWSECRSQAGTFILRIEDIDVPRTVPGSEQRIIDDLRWLGIEWDEGPDVGGPAGPYRQSERSSIYRAAFDYLREEQLVYPCRCSRKDLRSAPSAPHGSEDAIYPGTCRPENGCAPAAGEEVAWRFRVDHDPVVDFVDEQAGLVRMDLVSESADFVVLRRDGLWAYQLACAVDDGLMGITRVVRGADLLASTPRQIAVLRALGLAVPIYRHVPLMLDEKGEKLSKRDGSQGLDVLREQGSAKDEVLELLKCM